MTRLDPTLIVRRMMVVKDGNPVLDLGFHEGVNIVAGENGSGKSTVADFLFYVLGGDTPAWKAEAGRCDFVFAEVALNGDAVTLRREVADTQRRPMALSWGPLEDARRDAVEGWKVYPFASTTAKESFSQVMLRALGIPEAMRGDIASLLTMHQLLRLMYIDQETPFSRIFRQDQFDSVVTRSAIGDLLLGLYEPALYDMRLRLTELRREFSAVNAQYRGAREVLQTADAILTVEMLQQARAESVEERDRLASALEQLEQQQAAALDKVHQELQVQRAGIREALSLGKERFRHLLDRLESLEFEIKDSELFITSLRRRRESLDQSDVTRAALGSATFAFCPACFAELPEREEGHCHVCNSDAGEDRAATNLARLRHEIHMQLTESERLQGDRTAQRDQALAELPALEAELRHRQAEYDRVSRGARTGLEEETARINRSIGYVEREIVETDRRIRIAQTFEALSARRRELQADIAKLEEDIDERTSEVGDRRGVAEDAIARLGAAILRDDLPRQLKFQEAERLTFDFGDDAMGVGDRGSFSASSMVLLKNSFHLAILLASLTHDFFRYPRFLLCDNIEDKGMEVERAHNFQRLVVERSLSAEAEHQIIFTTSMLNPNLDKPEFVVARFTPQEKSLRF